MNLCLAIYKDHSSMTNFTITPHKFFSFHGLFNTFTYTIHTTIVTSIFPICRRRDDHRILYPTIHKDKYSPVISFRIPYTITQFTRYRSSRKTWRTPVPSGTSLDLQIPVIGSSASRLIKQLVKYAFSDILFFLWFNVFYVKYKNL